MTLESTRLEKEIRFALVTITIIITALILISTNSQNVLAVQYTNHTSDRYQIQFQYPSDWEFKEKMTRFDEGTDISVRKIALDNTGLIQIQRQNDTVRGFGSADFTTAFYKLFKDAISYDYGKDYNIIEQPSFTNIDGQKAGTFLYTQKDKYEDNAEPWGIQYWFVYVGDQGYLITFNSPTRMFDNPENTEIRDHFIKSIKFLGANNQTSTNTTNRFG
jgi:hypothetical protein